MLRVIEAIHRRGILDREIKPSNFLIHPSRRFPVALIDYGLSRHFKDRRTGERPGFVGTTKYASLNAHKGRELSRRDDLISWFFSMMECVTDDCRRLGQIDSEYIPIDQGTCF
jgi:serine/threonine protein kinase